MQIQVKIFRTVLIIAIAGLVTSCAGTSRTAVFIPPAGSLVELNEEISVGPRSRIFIQNGRVMERSGVSVVSTYCHFSLDPPGTGPDHTLRPDSFQVAKSYQRRDYASSENLQYAGRAGSDRTLSTIMELTSGNQPEVTRLTCSRWGMISEDGWPTIKEMQTALGNMVRIVLSE